MRTTTSAHLPAIVVATVALTAIFPLVESQSTLTQEVLYLHRGLLLSHDPPTAADPDSLLFSSLVPSSKRFVSEELALAGTLTSPTQVKLTMRAQGSFQGQVALVLDLDDVRVSNVTSDPFVVGATATDVEFTFPEFRVPIEVGQRLAITLDVLPLSGTTGTVVAEVLYDSVDYDSALSVAIEPPVSPPVKPPVSTPTPAQETPPEETPPVVTPEPEEDRPPSRSVILVSGIGTSGLAILGILGLAGRR